MENYFKVAGDLPPTNIDNKQKKENKPTGKIKYSKDLEKKFNKESLESKKEKIEKYLDSIVTPNISNEENIEEAGMMFVDLERLNEMIEEGYIIEEAEYINDNLINISFLKIKEKGRRL